MSDNPQTFWSSLVFIVLFNLVYFLKLPKRFGWKIPIQVAGLAVLHGLICTLFGNPNLGLMWLLISLTLVTVAISQFIVKAFSRAAVRPLLITGLAVPAIGLAIVLPGSAAMEAEWFLVWLLLGTALYAGIFRPKIERTPIGESDSDREALVKAMSNATDEMIELMLLSFCAFSAFFFAFIHLRNKWFAFNANFSYLTVALDFLALVAAVCLITFQTDKRTRTMPITKR